MSPWLHLTLLPCVAQVFIDDPLPQRRVDPAGAVSRAARLWLASGAYTHTATPSLPHTKIGEGASSSSLDGTCSSHSSTSSTMNLSYTQHELGSLRLLCRGSVDAYIASKVSVQRQARTPLSPASSPLVSQPGARAVPVVVGTKCERARHRGWESMTAHEVSIMPRLPTPAPQAMTSHYL